MLILVYMPILHTFFDLFNKINIVCHMFFCAVFTSVRRWLIMACNCLSLVSCACLYFLKGYLQRWDKVTIIRVTRKTEVTRSKSQCN
jgi:hypothetical protein